MKNEPIAIVGIGCRFPGGISSLKQLESTLYNGEDKVTNVPPERFDTEYFQHPDRNAPGKSCTFAAGIVNDIDQFDAGFFGFSPKEAQALDPQQRLTLEMAWEAFEDAGIAPSRWAGSKAAVFVGAASTDMAMIHSDDVKKAGPYSMTGTSLSIISNRLSYFFDLHGPSMTVDTACSSSLVALHEACQAIRHGEADRALAGGVNILLSPHPFIGFSKARMLSEDGRCKVFDAHGNGYVRSEGGAVVLLKKLSDALRDKDKIYAVIRATAVNSDGRTQGIALPNGLAQEALLRDIYSDPTLDKDALCYLEAHGTGTAVGDPIEVGSIGRVLGRKDRPLYIGSVKGNLGHLETGSGMAGLAKALIVFKNRTIPANIQCQELNPAIPFEALGVRVAFENTALPVPHTQSEADVTKEASRPLIGVNSFGFGGTNAHVILEAAPVAPQTSEPNATPQRATDTALPTLILSAQSKASLEALARDYAALLKGASDAQYRTLAAQVRAQREVFSERAAFGAQTLEDIIQALEDFAAGNTKNKHAAFVKAGGTAGKTAFIFSGNGSQWAGMGAALLKDAVFAEAISRIDAIFVPLAGWSIAAELQKNAKEWDLSCTEKAQALLFAVQVGFVHVLRARGITAEATAGHSVGEVAAAYAAGLLPLKEAVRVIYERSFHQGRTRGSGTMAAVRLEEEKFLALLPEGVEIAGWNSHQDYTVSGTAEALASLEKRVRASKGLYMRLALDYAFHSSHMDPIREGVLTDLGAVRVQEGAIPFYSTVEGKPATQLDARYWWRNIREAVKFREAIEALFSDGFTRFIEVGPHAILSGYLKTEAKHRGSDVFVGLTLKRHEGLEAFYQHLLTLEATLVAPGDTPKEALELPLYPWNKKRYWPEATSEGGRLFEKTAKHPTLGRRTNPSVAHWESEVDLCTAPWLADHQIRDDVLFPAALFIENALAAGRELFGATPFEVVNAAITRPLVLKKKPTMVLKTEVQEHILTMASKEVVVEGGWNEHVRARLTEYAGAAPKKDFATRGATFAIDGLYEKIRALGYRYGASFETLCGLEEVSENRFTAKLTFVPHAAAGKLAIPPGVLDGAFHALIAVAAARLKEPALFLPAWFGRIRLFDKGVPQTAEITIKRLNERGLAADILYRDNEGRALLELTDVRFRRAAHGADAPHAAFYTERWEVFGRKTALSNPAFVLSRITERLNECAPLSRESEVRPLVNLLLAALIYEKVLVKDEPVLAQSLFTDAFSVDNEEWVEYLASLLVDAGVAEGEYGSTYTVQSEAKLPASSLLWKTLQANHSALWPLLDAIALFDNDFYDLIEGRKTLQPVLTALFRSKTEDAHLNFTLASDRVIRDAVLEVLIAAEKETFENARKTPSFDGVFPEVTLRRIGLVAFDKADFSESLLQELARVADVTLYSTDPTAAERAKTTIEEKLGIAVEPLDVKKAASATEASLDLLWVTEPIARTENPEEVLGRLAELVLAGGGSFFLPPPKAESWKTSFWALLATGGNRITQGLPTPTTRQAPGRRLLQLQDSR